MENIGLITAFSVAILGSIGHCIGMCGGIVLAYSGKLANNGVVSKAKLLGFHLLYNLGRITTYVALGAAVGFIGSMFSLDNTLKAALFIIAGILMILAGLSLFGKIKFLNYLEVSLQNTKWYQNNFQQALNLKTPLSLYMLGILNGLLPCGFVYAFLFSAAGFGSALYGALIMLSFGLGTMPALFIFGLLANTILAKQSFRKIAMILASIAIIVFGALMAYKGYKILQNPQMGHKMHTHSIESTNKDSMHNTHNHKEHMQNMGH